MRHVDEVSREPSLSGRKTTTRASLEREGRVADPALRQPIGYRGYVPRHYRPLVPFTPSDVILRHCPPLVLTEPFLANVLTLLRRPRFDLAPTT